MAQCFSQYFLVISLLLFASVSKADISLDQLSQKYPSHQKDIAALSQGSTHYEDVGSKAAPVVVLIHGVSGPMTAWDYTVSIVTAAGYRAIRYDLYGRGFSSRLDGEYDLDFYIQQLNDLLAAREVDRPFSVVGSSFGCVIAAEFVRRNPQRVNGIVLIGPAGFPIEVPFLARLRDVPFLGDLAFMLMGKSIITEQNEKYFVDENAWEQHRPYFVDQLDVSHSAEAILSTMRHSPVQAYLEGYRELGNTSVPVGVIWGKEDATFPYVNHRSLQEVIPRMELVTIEKSAHLPQFERPKVSNKALLEFLDRFNAED